MPLVVAAMVAWSVRCGNGEAEGNWDWVQVAYKWKSFLEELGYI